MTGTALPRAGLLLVPVIMVLTIDLLAPLAMLLAGLTHVLPGSDHVAVATGSWLAPAGREALVRQLAFSVLSVVIEVPLGLIIASCLPRRGRGAAIWLCLSALPLLLPLPVANDLWHWLEQGLIHPALGNGHSAVAHYVMRMDTWQVLPAIVVLCHAGLCSIPADRQHAARIDGASPIGFARHVLWPHLKGIVLVAVGLRLVTSLRVLTGPAVAAIHGPPLASQYILAGLPGQPVVFALLYTLIIVLFCIVFHAAFTRLSRWPT